MGENKTNHCKKNIEKLERTYQTLSSQKAEYKKEISRLEQIIAHSKDPETILQCETDINDYEAKLDRIQELTRSKDPLLNHMKEELDAMKVVLKKLDEYDIARDKK